MRFHLPFGIRQNKSENTSYITKEEFRKLSGYASEHEVRLENFKHFKGDINTIVELIDDITKIAEDFPKILEGRKSLVISLDEHSSEDDFATTVGHIIYLNSNLYADLNYLKSEYDLAVQQGKFVAETDYHGVIRHELGHVVANRYTIDTMKIAKKILPNMTESDIIKYISNHVSLYAADFKDGREFISECFSAYYGGASNSFAEKYVKICKTISEKEDL